MSENGWHALGVEETLDKLKTNLQNGLASADIVERQKIYPANQIVVNGRDGALKRFLRQFNNELIYILIAAAFITVFLRQWADASVIFGVIIINAIFGFLQEGKAEKALEAIRNMLAPTAEVIRDGKNLTIAASELLPGDIVLIKRGDKVPADLRLAQTKNLQVEEAVLTGESLAAEKGIVAVKEDAVIGERYSMLYSGTLITDGYGIGVVVATGKDTEVGKISAALAKVESIDTPLLKQMNHFGRWLTVIIIAIAVVVFLVGAFVWHDLSSEMFMGIVGLTVAAVPEGLPPVITIILAIGVTRMARRNSIIRRLPAVETMGAVTTICTDKTGTLTHNRLKVQSLVTANNHYLLNGNTEFSEAPAVKTAIKGSLLCNDALIHHGDVEKVDGNPIDTALMNFGLSLKYDVDLMRQKFPRTDLISYETEHKFMASLNHDHEGNSFIYVKGAPEIILERCNAEQVDGKISDLRNNYWEEKIRELASAGERVIAVAAKRAGGEKSVLRFNYLENGLVLIGLFGLADPPREEAISAVRECGRAGIRVKMITGDHAVTAAAIAGRIGIGDGKVLSGDAIDKMSDQELLKVSSEIDIYARTTPQHKLRLVEALQKQGQVVAMTGDGVNDAPALRQADIGIAMGAKGADIAKESSEMVLADDNFATIVNAIREGRTIYDNLKKAILFILPISFAQAFVVIAAILFGLLLPITAVQILWVNMITAITLALALGFEKSERGIMDRPPRDPNVPLLSWHLLWRVLSVSLIMVTVVFGAFVFVYHQDVSLEVARTVAVNVLVAGEIMYLINCRNLKESSINIRTLFSSKPVLISIAIMIVLQLFFTYVPFMQSYFGTQTIGVNYWGYIIFAAVAAFGFIELEKRLLRF